VASSRVIPLFPLSSLLVPGLVLPLHIFEPRYRQLIADISLLPEDERGFGVVAIREGREVGTDGVQALYAVGTFASLREVTPLDDGRFDIITVGAERFRLGDMVEGKPYLQAEVEWLPEESGDATVVLAQAVRDRFYEYRSVLSDDVEDHEVPDDPRVLSYLVTAALITDLGERQALLEAPDDGTRLRSCMSSLNRELALIREFPSLPAVDMAREPYGLN
jgi:Lon protease-like protein